MKKTCFVVMGFGQKIDFQSTPQRTLDLDKTYQYIIKPAVEAAGLACIRADEEIHSGVIDKPMYERLLDADVVVADLSTANANAIYELGVRHALRPHTTIVMAESQFKFPFDLNHVTMLTYTHLGTGIDFGEVMRVQQALKDKITHLVDGGQTDSPVFLFLPQLLAAAKADAAAKAVTQGVPPPASIAAPVAAAAPMAPAVSQRSFAELLDSFRAAKAAVAEPADWVPVAALVKALRKMQPDDPFLVQQLALATYKAERPDKLQALRAAEAILAPLSPATSSDAETVGLWGAVHKRLWEEGGDKADLDKAIRAYQRGFFLKDDHYTGINFAYLLDVRASVTTGEEAAADRVLANRYRREVLGLCETLLQDPAIGDQVLNAATRDDPALQEKFASRYWILASRAEAAYGLGRDDAQARIADALQAPAEGWMHDSLRDQLAKLKALGR